MVLFKFKIFPIIIIFVLSWIILFNKNLLADTKIVFLGDSITAGYKLDKKEAYPYLIQKKLAELKYKDFKIINGGVNGSTTASAKSRLIWYLRVKPNILFLALGANDGLRGKEITSIKNNLSQAIKLALKNNIKVILAGMKIPTNYGKKYSKQFENIFSELAKKYKIDLMPFLLKDVATKKELNLNDGIHPNPKGHQVISKNVLPYITKLLKK